MSVFLQEIGLWISWLADVKNNATISSPDFMFVILSLSLLFFKSFICEFSEAIISSNFFIFFSLSLFSYNFIFSFYSLTFFCSLLNCSISFLFLLFSSFNWFNNSLYLLSSFILTSLFKIFIILLLSLLILLFCSFEFLFNLGTKSMKVLEEYYIFSNLL